MSSDICTTYILDKHQHKGTISLSYIRIATLKLSRVY